jgi:hypothetical protein
MAKRSKTHQTFILTANDLTTGDVVFWTNKESWQRDLHQAIIINGDQVDTMQTIGKAEESMNRVIGSYLAPVKLTHGTAQPLELRERRRVSGPSITYNHSSHINGLAA